MSQQIHDSISLNKVLQKIDLSKNSNNESCSSSQIFFVENHLPKDSADFWHRKLTLKMENFQFSKALCKVCVIDMERYENKVVLEVKCGIWTSNVKGSLLNSPDRFCVCLLAYFYINVLKRRDYERMLILLTPLKFMRVTWVLPNSCQILLLSYNFLLPSHTFQSFWFFQTYDRSFC